MSNATDIHAFLASILQDAKPYNISPADYAIVKRESESKCIEYYENTPLKNINLRLGTGYASKEDIAPGEFAHLLASFLKGCLGEFALYKLLADADIMVKVNELQHIVKHNWWDFKLTYEGESYYFDVKVIRREPSWISFNPFSKISTQYNAPEPVSLVFLYLDDTVVTPVHMITHEGLVQTLTVSLHHKHLLATEKVSQHEQYDNIMSCKGRVFEHIKCLFEPDVNKLINVYIHAKDHSDLAWQFYKPNKLRKSIFDEQHNLRANSKLSRSTATSNLNGLDW
jgi:hypothetical protein